MYQRFRRWRDNGTWEKVLEMLIGEPDFEWLMIDTSHVKVHPNATDAVGAIKIWENIRVLNTPIHLAVDANGVPIRALVTSGITADCTQAIAPIYGAHGRVK